METRAKLALLGSLYLAQGLPFGFFTQALPVLLRESGMSLPAIGFTSLLALPWALKFLWAPLVDRHASSRLGPRRGWILPLQAASVLTLVLLATVDPGRALPVLVAGFLLTNLLSATQDVATDGLAVDVLEPHERGLGNGVQVAGYRLGMIVGGGALLVSFDELGWSGTFLTMAGLLAVSTVPVALHRERRREARPAGGALPLGRALAAAVTRPGMRRWLIALALYKAGDAFASGMLRPFLVDRGLGLAELGWLLGAAGFTAGLVGALLGGWGAGRLGTRTALVGFGLVQAVAVGGYWWVARDPGTSADAVAAACLFEHLAGGLATAALFTRMMDECRQDEAATDYTLQASVVVASSGAASALSGVSAGAWGYAGHFGLAALACVVGVLATSRAIGSAPSGWQARGNKSPADTPSTGWLSQVQLAGRTRA